MRSSVLVWVLLAIVAFGGTPVFGVILVGDPAAPDDFDRDGVPDLDDNCLLVENADQSDVDGDGFGDVCDVCPTVSDRDQLDFDEDGVGDECDLCPNEFDPDQLDSDGNGVGDVCDSPPDSDSDDSFANDSDGDGVVDELDECPDSDDSPTVVIFDCESGVANELYDSGCTLSDRITPHLPELDSRRWRFWRSMIWLLRDLRHEGVIDRRDAKALFWCTYSARYELRKKRTRERCGR